MIGDDHPRAVAARHFLWFEELASCALYRSQVEAYRVL